MSALIKNLTTADFNSTISGSPTPVLVDFWAAWCGPCKAIAPILDDLATELNGKLTIAKVDVDTNSELASQFQVQAIPTLLLFKNGQLATRIVGMVNKASLKAKIDPLL
jgi:thioredoxin 1